MKYTIYRCVRCNESMETYNVSRQGGVIPVGYVCMKNGCDRNGLISIVSKQEEIEEAV